MIVNLTENARRGLPVLALGFRPFFLLAGLAGACAILLWVAILQGWLSLNTQYPGHYWHVHEMLFGYAAAVIVGFLLTASKNWTGVQTLNGPGLAALALLWVLARLLPFTSLAMEVTVVVQALFFAVGSVAVFYPVLVTRKAQHLVFGFIAAGLGVAGFLVQAQFWLGSATAEIGLRSGVALISILILIMGNRVIPFFIERGLGVQLSLWPQGFLPMVGSFVAWNIAWVMLGNHNPWIGYTALPVLALMLLYMRHWYTPKIWTEPMLWILFIGIAFMPLGLLLWGLSAFGIVPPSMPVHALMAGAMGCLTVGMMARVTLGHTGRPMRASRNTVWMFVLISAAALSRLLAELPTLAAEKNDILLVAGVLWTAAFVLFLAEYGRMLLSPRADGQPG